MVVVDGWNEEQREEEGEKDTERFPPSCGQTEGTLNYVRELRHVITDNLRLFRSLICYGYKTNSQM